MKFLGWVLVLSCIVIFVGLVSFTTYWLVRKLKHENAISRRGTNSSGLLTEHLTVDYNESFNTQIKEDSVKLSKELM